MTTTTADLVRATVQALLAARTDALDRVYTPGDWPTKTSEFPVLLVQGRREDKFSLGRGATEFNVVSTIRVTGRVSAPGAAADAGGEHAEDRLWRLQRQVECAVINAPWTLNGAPILQQYPTISSQVGVNSEGQVQVAELVMEIGMEYYQGPEDFYPIPTAPLERVTVSGLEPAHTPQPGLDISFPPP